jgi:hypothetical protein
VLALTSAHTGGVFVAPSPLQPHLLFLNRWMDSLVLCFRHRLDQQRERLAETRGAGRFASIVPETHHDQIVRGNHQHRLPAGARHVIRIARDWISPVAVEPKESSIDRSIVRGPGGRNRADTITRIWVRAWASTARYQIGGISPGQKMQPLGRWLRPRLPFRVRLGDRDLLLDVRSAPNN